MRFSYGWVVPWVHKVDDEQAPEGRTVAVAGPDSVWFDTECPDLRPGPDDVRGLHRGAGRPDRVHHQLAALAQGRAAARRPRGLAGGDRAVLARVGRPVHVPRSLPGRGGPLADHPQGAHLRADRRHRRRADHLAARGHRRRAQLGLPLHLAARRGDHPVVAAAHRLPRRGPRLARVAAAGGGRRPGEPPDHVRDRRRAGVGRDRAALAARLRGLDAGPGRQRRRPPAPARRVRRGQRGAAPGPHDRAGPQRLRRACSSSS